jgi:acyl-CoA reductase-like NAD-dependent aldehyde dehydrogenase
MTIKAINPATGEQFASYEEMTDAGDAIGKAHEAFLAWRRIDRQRSRRTRRGRQGRLAFEEDGARTGRQRSLPRA